MNNDDNETPVANSDTAPEFEQTSSDTPAIESTPTPSLEATETPTPTLTTTPEVIAPPVVAPVATPEVASPQPHVNTPGVIILQWLSYAFWGWLILALIWLMAVLLTNAITGVSVSSVVPYAIAAGVVLLPIAFTTDLFYRKHEPIKKTGAAMIIMVIHAVIFAILAIASLIVVVFNGLNALIEAGGNVDAQMVILYTSIGATLLYAVTFLRTLNPFKTKTPLVLYSVIMVVLTVVLIVLAIVGPLVQTIAAKDDRRIEDNLPTVASSINSYVVSNEELPENLDQVSYDSDEAQAIVDDGLVVFKPEQVVTSPANPNYTYHRYQLCVTYKQESEVSASGYGYSYSNKNNYSSYVSTYGHGKGEVCYKVEEVVRVETTSNNSIDLDINIGSGN